MNSAKKTILVIEDEKEMARGLKDILEFEGYEVINAASGREGLDAVSRKPDCIILDLMLPDLNGYQVCEQVRRWKLKVPILMLTAKAQEYDKIRGFEVGADDYLTKPFSVGELLARVMALLRRSDQYAPESADRACGLQRGRCDPLQRPARRQGIFPVPL